MKIGIVLNFNNYNSTIHCVNNLIESNIDKVIIVDNDSDNNSFLYLKRAFKDSEKVDVLCSRRNVGYAAGNNIGLRYVKDNYGDDNIIYIVNPDSLVNKNVVNHIATFIREHKGIGMVTVKMNGSMNSTWHQTRPMRGLLFNFWFLSYLLGKVHITEGRHYRKIYKDAQRVDVVTGAFFGIDQRAIYNIGLFDENTFLYYEEEILSCKLKLNGYKNYILTKFNFKHEGQGSTHFNRFKIKKINDKSRLYYLTEYRKVSKLYVHIYKSVNAIDDFFLKWLLA